MSSIVVADKISMGYRIYSGPLDLVKETVLGGIRHDTFWALKDISLNLKKASVLES